MSKYQSEYAYFITLVLAMSLNILPLSETIKCFNPDWVLLVLIYWILAIPERYGVFSAWVVGILVDVLTGRVIGMHGLTYSLVSYACLKLHKRLRQYPLPQQSLFILFCLFLSQSIIFWIENIQSRTEYSFSFWLPVLMGMLVWPLVYACLRFISSLGRGING